MTFPESSARWERGVLASMLPLSAVAVLPAAVEPFMLPKVTALAVLAFALMAVIGSRIAWEREVAIPVSPIFVATAALAGALMVATLTSSNPWTSMVGWYGRYTGLLPYLLYLVVFVAAVRRGDSRLFDLLRRVLLVTLAPVVGYGILQFLGADPVTWVGQGPGGAFSFLANVNFVAAWTGAVAALALVTALQEREHRTWRWFGGALTVLTFVYVFLTGTSQGPVVVVLSLSWVCVVLASEPGSAARRLAAQHRRSAWALLAAAVAAAGAAIAVVFPFLRAELDQAFVERPVFWSVALQIFADRPILGTGLDTYGHFFTAYRPASHALLVGAAGADAPHSVPLGMLANGGLVLGLTYLAVVVMVGVALVRGAFRTSGTDRAVLAGFGGVWLGYQAQSLVSYDVPPLAMLHWVSAGVIVAVAAPPKWRTLRLPGSPPSHTKSVRGRPMGPVQVPTSTRVLQGGIAVVAVVAMWFALYPLRADLLAASAAPLGQSGQLDAAVERFDRAAELNPAEPSYPLLAAQASQAAGQYQQGYRYAVEAATRDPGDVQAALLAAWQAQQDGDLGTAERWYRQAVERDPRHPAVLADVAAFFVAQERYDDAEPYLREALTIDPDHAKSQELMAVIDAS